MLFLDRRKRISSVEMGLLPPPFTCISEMLMKIVCMQQDISLADLVLVIEPDLLGEI